MADETPKGKIPEADNVTFEAWLDSQTDEIKNRFSQGTQGLRSALNAERDNTKSLSKQLKELQGAAEKGSDLEKQITALQAKLTESERHSAFIDGAEAAGCANAKAAYKLACADEELWKRDGSPDWEAIKATAPELFGSKRGKGGAGNGRLEDPNAGTKMHKMDYAMRQRLGIID